MQQTRKQPAVWWSPAQPRTITVRPIQPADADLINAMHQRLSPESLYYRYLQHRQPTLAEIMAVCHLAPTQGTGLVAVKRDEAAIVGLAYYVREPHELEPIAEPGILVEDRFQAQGIGRSLWQQLQHAAQQDGLRWLRVLFHPANERLARLVQGGGQPYIARSHGGLHEYLVDLDKAPTDSAGRGITGTFRAMLVGHWRTINNHLTWRWQAP